ncbi:sterile alpha motif domain-containing protein 14 isoform X5 [Hydra vulgaris]|uniref:Sterile alpha motif domain-containing protein 14 isoform X5 n=1 Tax=Hydra vulgaris TaxID=6087 RepID=A0ABM4CWQ9_HYDVU
MEPASVDSKKRSMKAGEKKLSKEHIGFPADFRHVSHVSWDPKGGFEINNIDPQWKKLFGAIGVTEKQLEDEEKAKLASEFVESHDGSPPLPVCDNGQPSFVSTKAATLPSKPTGTKFSSAPLACDDTQPLPASRSVTLPTKPVRSDVMQNKAEATLSLSILKKGKSKAVVKRLSKEDIGFASDFRHIGHVGFDSSSYAQSGFESSDAENPIKEQEEPDQNLEYSDPLKNNDQYLTSPQSWTVEDVSTWLRSIALEDYVDVFTVNAIDGTELMCLNDDSLSKSLNISPLGHRNKIMREINQLKQLSYYNDGMVGCNNDNDVVPSDFLCPITMEIMVDPVIAADGFTYEKKSILSWFSSGKVTSPMTNIPLSHTELVPNRSLKNVIEKFFGP